MPNLFLGFPVSRAKIADIVLGSAPPTVHASQHENGGSDEISVTLLSGVLADAQIPLAHDLDDHNAVTLAELNTKVSDATLDKNSDARTPSAHKASHEDGGSDELDVTGLVGAGGGGGINPGDYFFTTWFEAITGYKQSTGGSGSISHTNNELGITTGSTASSYARLMKELFFNDYKLSFARITTIVCQLQLKRRGTVGPTIQIAAGGEGTSKHIGFILEELDLQGSVGNGSTRTKLSLLTIPAFPTWPEYNLRVEFTPGVKAEFFIDNVSKGSITTNLPTGDFSSSNPMVLRIDNNAETDDSTIAIKIFSFYQALV